MKNSYKEKKFWKPQGYCKQPNIDLRKIHQGIIRVKVEGHWDNYQVQKLPDTFFKWSINERLKMLKRIKSSEALSLAGSHNGIVATCGGLRYDTQFSINCAVKGMGFLPKKDKLENVLGLLKSTINDDFIKKLAILENLYNCADEIFDQTKQVSLELYSTPDFETHTFINQMTDPRVAIVFLDIPSFEIKAIAQLIHPNDPTLSQYERSIVDFVNTVHDYFHSRSPRQSITVVYHVVEVFDNTPGKARGQRISPPLA
ncbi:MAG: hypothetical protein N2166_02860 [candidate division WOR-3 bacterium]|nr:hypothetical protein [candidate division WOR-3 bacterium]